MKAIILAGGFGTRLRPLSCTRPKLMFPVANRPLLDWTLERLSKAGVDTVVLAVNYMAEALEKYFKRNRYGMKIIYSRELKPLGTGGPIKKAEGFLRSGDDPFWVLNGDILSRIDYNALLNFHRENGGDATIALREVEDPSRFGVVELNESNQILRFVEKPKPEEAPSNLINAGIYLMKPEVFDLIPEGKVSTEREIFPIMANERKLYGFRFDGMWIDTGVPSDFLEANRMMLNLIAKKKPAVKKGAEVHKKAKLVPPVVVGEDVKVEANALVGPYTALGDGVAVGKGSEIRNSIIFPNVFVGKFASITGSIVGKGAKIGQRVKVGENCIVGDNVNIHDDVILTSKVRICPFKEVKESILKSGIVT